MAATTPPAGLRIMCMTANVGSLFEQVNTLFYYQ
jgi:hypothetical protein